MSQVWMPGTQGTEYWPSGAKLKSSGGEPESSREERWSTVVEDKMTPILVYNIIFILIIAFKLQETTQQTLLRVR
ncbi:hypothetical protein TYRP_022923 [Tyrophagus putrescentiae]|nr:hypothetical protein TYRP_022923 [Tyrophagus putrescentiae]